MTCTFIKSLIKCIFTYIKFKVLMHISDIFFEVILICKFIKKNNCNEKSKSLTKKTRITLPCKIFTVSGYIMLICYLNASLSIPLQ